MKLQWRIAALKNGFKDATAYRWEFLFEILGSAFVPAAIQLVLWYALFKNGDKTELAGMDYRDMIHYTLVSVLFSQVRGGDHDFELSEMIRSGSLSNYLLRPVNAIQFVYIRGVGPRLFIALFCLIVGAILSWTMGYSAIRMIGAMFLALIGNIIHFQIGTSLAAAAFAWEEAYSVLMVKNMIVSILSGELMPLSLFPSSMEWIWKSTPFYLYVYGPTQYALGHWTHQEYLQGLAWGGLWILGAWAMIKITWGLGMKRYASIGG